MTYKFEKLEVWQLALNYVDLVYHIAEQLPRSEEFNLKAQMIRAATSVALNIAEGSTGQTDSEQARFLGMAIRSLIETVACQRIIIRRKMMTNGALLHQADNDSAHLAAKLHVMRKRISPEQNWLREAQSDYLVDNSDEKTATWPAYSVVRHPSSVEGTQPMQKVKPTIQISIDVTTLDEAMALAREAVAAGVDWLEAGTPLILAEGMRGVQMFRREFPDVPIVADLKTMDGAGLEAEVMFKAGANMVVVMGQAADASILEQVRAAKQYGGKVMCDVMLCPDKPERARQAQTLGVDYIIVHTGFDERNLARERHGIVMSPLDDLPGVLAAVDIPVQAVGGLSIDQAIKTLEMGAQIVVFGAPLVIAGHELKPQEGFEQKLREIVQRVKQIDVPVK
jgi:3-hexulose-6-phosphate synthase